MLNLPVFGKLRERLDDKVLRAHALAAEEKKKNEEEIKKILEDAEDTIKKYDNFVKEYGL